MSRQEVSNIILESEFDEVLSSNAPCARKPAGDSAAHILRSQRTPQGIMRLRRVGSLKKTCGASEQRLFSGAVGPGEGTRLPERSADREKDRSPSCGRGRSSKAQRIPPSGASRRNH
jgi:hypothetical protein